MSENKSCPFCSSPFILCTKCSQDRMPKTVAFLLFGENIEMKSILKKTKLVCKNLQNGSKITFSPICEEFPTTSLLENCHHESMFYLGLTPEKMNKGAIFQKNCAKIWRRQWKIFIEMFHDVPEAIHQSNYLISFFVWFLKGENEERGDKCEVFHKDEFSDGNNEEFELPYQNVNVGMVEEDP